ncbi:MAG: GIY-YIG nuclease family protein [Patescibacteria group bacterium]
MVYFTYILECSDKTLYVGSTNNLERRLHAHNHLKSGAHYTKIRRPVVLKYSEKFLRLGEARKREAELKGWNRQKKLTLITERTKTIASPRY